MSSVVSLEHVMSGNHAVRHRCLALQPRLKRAGTVQCRNGPGGTVHRTEIYLREDLTYQDRHMRSSGVKHTVQLASA
jgi:hypothetical protein